MRTEREEFELRFPAAARGEGFCEFPGPDLDQRESTKTPACALALVLAVDLAE